MKRIVTLVLIVALLVPTVLFAAGAKEAAAKETYIAVISMGYMHEYWQAVRLGTENAAKELGIRTTYEAPPSEDMVDLQINMVENAIQTKPDNLLLAPLDAEALVPYIDKAVKAGIGGSLDAEQTPTPSPRLRPSTMPRHRRQNMIRLLGDKGTIGLIVHSATDQSAIKRRDGFELYESQLQDQRSSPRLQRWRA